MRALEEEVQKRLVTRLLMTHPGVGPLTALVYELVIGTPERFHCGKRLASNVGLVPVEKSSGDRRCIPGKTHLLRLGTSRDDGFWRKVSTPTAARAPDRGVAADDESQR